MKRMLHIWQVCDRSGEPYWVTNELTPDGVVYHTSDERWGDTTLAEALAFAREIGASATIRYYDENE